MELRISAFGLSEVGRVRFRNEDSLCVEPSTGLVVVADGMGGAPGGDVASALAVQEVARGIHAGAGMQEAIRSANRRIFEAAAQQPELAGMGTTVTALKVDAGEGTFVVGHVGDSRAYRWRKGGLEPLTEDHTLVRRMVRMGRLPPSAERNHPLSHVLVRVLGTEPHVPVDVTEGDAEPGDRFLLCSDGLVKVVTDDELGRWMERARPTSLRKTIEGLVALGLERGAPDNITVALLIVEAGRPR